MVRLHSVKTQKTFHGVSSHAMFKFCVSASGEPPQCMSCSVMFALRKCIELARLEVGNNDYFKLGNTLLKCVIDVACAQYSSR